MTTAGERTSPDGRQWRVELHCHSSYSPDCGMGFDDLIRVVQQRGLTCLALTDHNRLSGAAALRAIAPFPVVLGEEVRTREGEIIGLFLTEEIPSHLTPEETVARIRAQGGVVYVPHPFDRFRGSRLSPAALERIVNQVDVLEVWNGRTLLPSDNLRAAAYAARHGLLRAAASDAHTTGEVGRSHVIVRPFHDAPSFLAAMADAQLVERLAGPWVHLASRWHKLRSRQRATR